MGLFQIAVRTVLPSNVTSRGSPTFTESNRGIPTPLKSSVGSQSFCLLPATSRGSTIHVENLSAHMTGLHKIKNSIDNIFYRSLFNYGLRRVVGITPMHRCIHNAGGYGIEANAIVC